MTAVDHMTAVTFAFIELTLKWIDFAFRMTEMRASQPLASHL